MGDGFALARTRMFKERPAVLQKHLQINERANDPGTARIWACNGRIIRRSQESRGSQQGAAAKSALRCSHRGCQDIELTATHRDCDALFFVVQASRHGSREIRSER